MPASARLSRALRRPGIAVAVAACLVLPARPVAAGPGAAVIERARVMEREGAPDEGERVLRDAIAGDGKLAHDAAVLLELARITRAASEILDLTDRAIGTTRDARLLVEAHRMRGDYLYMEARYLAAAREYALASRYGPRSVPDEAALRRAASFLAAGDASEAAEAYRELTEKGSVPTDLTPWAELGLARTTLLGGDATGAAARFEEIARAFASRDVRLEALVGLWESREAAGDVEGEEAAIETLTREYPGTFGAVIARERLRALELPDATLRTESPDTTQAYGAPREGETGDGAQR